MAVSIDLSGTRALVTGGSRGIGRAISTLLTAAGSEVGITFHRREDTAKEVVESGNAVWEFPVAVGDETSVSAWFREVDRRWPDGIDILVANAGVWPTEDRSLSEIDWERWRTTTSTNLDGVFLTLREGVQRTRNRGSVVLIGSGAGIHGEPGHADYAATKAALNGLTRTLCVELAPRDITVNCIAPGWIATDMIAYAIGEKHEEIIRQIPFARIGSVDDVAGAVLFLCSRFARHVSGATIRVSGGVY